MNRPDQLRIELRSDTTFSSGHGTAGEVDVEIEHDGCGLPCLRGKTLHGLLLDAWLSMSHAFPDLEPAAARVLGVEGALASQAILRVGDGLLPEQVRQATAWACGRDEQRVPARRILRALTDIRRQTSQDRATGAPETGSLRTIRVARQGLSFAAPLTWLAPPTADDLRVLAMAALAVRGAGLGRSRGRGRVALSLRESGQDRTSAWAFPAATAPQPAATTPAEAAIPEPAAASGPATVVEYHPLYLTLAAPLLAGEVESDPNSVRTARVIPGSTIRGAFAARLAPAELDDLVLSGNVRYLNGYPLTAGRLRALPAPVTLRAPKRAPVAPKEPQELFDLATYAGGEPGSWPAEPLTGPGVDFAAGRGEQLERAEVATTLRVHHQRDRQFGRARTGSGAIFAYESLEPGQTFAAVLAVTGRGADEAAARRDATRRAGRLRDAAAEGLLLGRSKLAQYGGLAACQFGDEPLAREVEATFPDAAVSKELAAGEECYVLLAADYVGRDLLTGQLDAAAFAGELLAALPGGEITGSYLRFTLAGGYNRRWGTPLPQAPALAAGSLLRLRATGAIPLAELRRVEDTSLGERTAEGFGRVVFLATLPRQLPPRGEPAAPPPPAASDEPLLAELQERLVAMAADEAVTRKVAELAKRVTGPITKSLLGRLRGAFRGGTEQGLQTLATWLGDGKNGLRDTARKQLGACKVDGKSLANWLGDLAGDPTKHGIEVEVQRWRLAPGEGQVRLHDRELTRKLIEGLFAEMGRKR